MEKINEKESFKIELDFYDEDDEAVIPDGGTYSILDVQSNTYIVEDVAFTPDSATYSLVITAANNTILDDTNETEKRRITVEYTYGTDGSGVTEIDYLCNSLTADLSNYYADEDAVKARVSIEDIGETPSEELILSAIKAGNVFVDGSLSKAGVDAISGTGTVPESVQMAATMYAVADVLQPLFNSQVESQPNYTVKYYQDQADMYIQNYIKTHENINENSVFTSISINNSTN